jgi:hypothetical protein
MRAKTLDRRAFLLRSVSTVGLGSALALVARSSPASAFELQPLRSGSKLALEIKNHCSENVEHEEIRAALLRNLDQRMAAPGTLLTETEYCPICGCPIIATRYVK